MELKRKLHPFNFTSHRQFSMGLIIFSPSSFGREDGGHSVDKEQGPGLREASLGSLRVHSFVQSSFPRPIFVCVCVCVCVVCVFVQVRETPLDPKFFSVNCKYYEMY